MKMNLLKDTLRITAHAKQVWLMRENFTGDVNNVYIFRKEVDGDFAVWASAFLRRKVIDMQYTKNAIKIKIK